MTDQSTTERIAELKKLAEAATQGTWELHKHGVIKAGPLMEFTNGSGRKQIVMTTGAEWMREGEQYDNAAFIAAANPQAILSLIGHIAELERKLSGALLTLQNVTNAAQSVVDRWNSPKWKDERPTAEFIYRLRDAIAAVNHKEDKA